MARLQILELPEGGNDDRPPFVLVVDQMPATDDAFEALCRDLGAATAEKIGARALLVFETTIDIPANDTTAYLNAADSSLAADTRYEAVIDGKPVDWTLADMNLLAKWKNELADALGIDRNRDWDDIRNAAAGLRKQRDSQSEAIERVRNLHRPADHQGITICAECSAWDGHTTDNSPCGYEHCPTLKALAETQLGADA